MAWIALIVSGALEAVWANALSKSHGFTRVYPTLLFLAGVILSMAGLAYALRTLPTGTAYATWVGIGTVLTVAYATATGEESISVLKVTFLGGIVVSVMGLKLLD